MQGKYTSNATAKIALLFHTDHHYNIHKSRLNDKNNRIKKVYMKSAKTDKMQD